jgi:DNA-binding XRE family transcriptional regulator
MVRSPERVIGGHQHNTVKSSARRGRPPAYSPAEKILMNLGARLKTLREERGLTIAQVAKKSGVAPQTIIQLEETGRPIRFPVMHQIAECLGHKLEFRLSKPKD